MNAQRSIWIPLIIGLGLTGLLARAEESPAHSKSAEPKPSLSEKPQPAASPAAVSPAAGQTAEDSGFSGLLDDLWLKVRQTMMSEEGTEASAQDSRTTAVAGLRGARTQDHILKPIWKGKSREKPLPADLELFEQAKMSYEKADYPAAVSALLEFQKTYPASPVRPPAQVLLALSYIQSHNPVEARKTLDEFLKAFPDHALCEQVKQLQTQLAPAPPP
jgi:TolA-binding protein